MKNQINTSEGNVQFTTPDGKRSNVHPFHVYAVFNEDTVSFMLIAMPKASGLSVFTSRAEDLLVNGESYTIDELPDALAEAFAIAGAQARAEVVPELPESGMTNTIYLVPIVDEETGEVNRYDEYIWIKDEERWELLGDTSIEMSRYLKKTDFNTYSAATKVTLDNLRSDVTYISGAVDTEVAARISDVNALSGAIDTEIARAQAEEANLQAAIDAEESARIAADNVISGAVDTEIARAQSAESALSDRIDAEVTRAEGAEALLDAAIDAEESARIAADNAIDARITEDEEVTAAAFNDVNDRIDSLSGSVDSEIASLQAAINAEESARISADGQLSTAIENEAQRALNAESDLSDRIDGHVSNLDIHVTVSDKAAWNAKLDASAIVDFFDGAEYDSNSKRINFKHGNDIKAYIDATAFIKDGMVSSVEIVNDKLVITFNSDAGKEAIEIPLSSIFNPANYYTKTEVDALIDELADDIDERLSEDEEVTAAAIVDLQEKKLDASAYTPTDLSNYYTKSEVNNAITAATSTKQDTLVSGTNIKTVNNESLLGSGNITIEGGNNVIELTQAEYDALQEIDPEAFYIITDAASVDLDDYYTKTETDVLLDEKLDASAYTPTDLSNYYNKTESDGKYATITNLNSHTADTTVHVTSAEKTAWNNKSDFSGSYNDLTNKPTIPTVPTSNTAFTNDAGYITTAALNGYATETWVGNQGYLTQHQDISGKQDVSGMTAYTQNAAFTAHTADTGVHVTSAEKTAWNNKLDASAYTPTDLSNYYTKSQTSGATEISTALNGKQDVISDLSTIRSNASNAVTQLGGISIVKITQSAYDALATKDADTLYVITD